MIVVSLLGFLFIIAIASLPEPQNTNKTNPELATQEKEETTPKPDKYPGDSTELRIRMKDEYMSSCMQGANYDYCKCTWDYLLDKYGMEEFMNKALEAYETGEMPEEMWEAADHCMDKIDTQSLPDTSNI